MVSLPLLIALLTLIDVTRSFEYFIDLERCRISEGVSNPETVCYVRASCVNTTAPGDPNKLSKWLNQKLNNDTCDVIVQMKAFTKSRYHVMMQVNVSANEQSASDELDINIGASIVQKVDQIKCNTNGITGRLFKNAFGTRQIYTKNLIFCSAILALGNDLMIENSFSDISYDGIDPSIEIAFASKEKEIVVYPEAGFWAIPEKCNDEKVITKNITDGELIMFEIDSAPATLLCPKSQKIRIKLDDQLFITTTSIVCNKANRWIYKNSEGADVTIGSLKSFQAYCSIKFTELCAETPLLFKECKNCIKPTPVEIDTLECPDHKWRQSDGSVLKTTVKCKRIGTEKRSGWTLENGKEITEGSCSTEYDCFAYNDLDFERIPTADGARSFQKAERSDDDNTIECGAGFNLTIISNDKTEEVSTSLTCDPNTGLYNYGAKTIPKSKNAISVYCTKTRRNETAADKENQPATGAMSGVVIGGSVGGVIAVMLIGGLIAFFVLKRSKEKQQLEKKRQEEELSTCLEIDPTRDRIRLDGTEWILDEIPQWERDRLLELKRTEAFINPVSYNVEVQVREQDAEVFPREHEFNHWDEATFCGQIAPNFHRYSTENRMKCLRAATTFRAINDPNHGFIENKKEKMEKKREAKNAAFIKAKKEGKKPSEIKAELKKVFVRDNKGFGTIDQFFELIYFAKINKLKCWETWESLFRLSKFFVQGLSDTTLHFSLQRYRAMFTVIGREMLKDLGMFGNANDTEQMKGIRQIALRMLWWANDKDIVKFISEQAAKPLDQIDPAIAPVIYSYAVREGGREREVMEAFHKEMATGNREHYNGVPFGTHRHHLMYALCTCKESSVSSVVPEANFGSMREILKLIHENKGRQANEQGPYTPTDWYFAYRGAAEFYDSCMVAVYEFAIPVSKMTEADIEKWVRIAVTTAANEDLTRIEMYDRFKYHLVSTMTMLAESCFEEEYFEALSGAWPFLVKYAVPVESDESKKVKDKDPWSAKKNKFHGYWNVKLMKERVTNVNFIRSNFMFDLWISNSITRHGFEIQVHNS